MLYNDVISLVSVCILGCLYYFLFQSKCSPTSFGLGVALGAAIGLALFFGLYFGLPPRQSDVVSPSPTTPPTANPPHSKLFQHAAVAADAAACSTIGKEILQKGGSVVDSAIASMLCVGLYNAHRLEI